MLSSQPNPIRYNDLDSETLISLLSTAMVGRIGMIAEGEPYTVPMNYVYEHAVGGALGRVIIHGANQGRMVRALGGLL